MTDARVPRRAQVVLLDDRKLDFLVQPRLLSRELLDMVASHFNLHEKEYFGLYHTDDIGNENWLSLDRKVLDHDFPRYADPIVFYFAVRFYVPSITYFREKATVELFYLQAKTLIFKGNIHCESDVVFQLGAYVLQATFGEFTNESAARNDIKKVPILPTRTLKEHPSITYCEDMVIGHYRKLEKMRKGQAIVEYLNKFRSIPTYGVHYYEVKDKGNIPWWLGMSPKGVGVYDHSDKTKPRKVYKWLQIENLYFKERKFSIEIKNLRKISEVSLDGGRQRSNSLGRRVNGQSRVLLHAWYASTTVQAKAMWTMAISQHQFYLDKRDQEEKLKTPRTLEDIANELSRSSGSLNSSMASVISDSSEPSESGHSSNGGKLCLARSGSSLILSHDGETDAYHGVSASYPGANNVLKNSNTTVFFI
ncbi:FERM domain-containing 4A isoform X5 [Paramuricea clavata]|uniref:FERM domain-containing 4A isoform X5 n=1 Tax=Paramuricea clavata TaxID=317549 RepID=A0A7D9DEJ4_PARCT|nr:FERM domain-containing 4A isoform X5 [Paramuricea clavata]